MQSFFGRFLVSEFFNSHSRLRSSTQLVGGTFPARQSVLLVLALPTERQNSSTRPETLPELFLLHWLGVFLPGTFYRTILLLCSSPYACHHPKRRMQRPADQLCAEFRSTTHAFLHKLTSSGTHVAIGAYEVCMAQ